MAENRLDLILAARHDELSQGLAQARANIDAFARGAEGGADAAGAAFEEMAEKAEELEQATEGAGDEAEETGKKFKQVSDEARGGATSFEQLKGPLTELGLIFGGFAAGAGLLTKGFLDAASQMQQFEATLTAVMHSSTEAKKALNEMVAFAASTPFEVPSIVQAGVQIRSLGLDMQRIVPLAGELAAVFNRDIPDAANALGKAMSGSQDGITMLADAFGISRTKMREFGAEADSTGSILTKTPEQVKKLQDALERIVKAEFGGAMAAQADTVVGAFSNLSDSVGRLTASMGEQLIPMATEGARRIGALVDEANKLPEAVKAIGAFGVVGAGAIAGLVGGMLGLVTVAGVVITNFKALDEALVKTLGPEKLFNMGARFAAVAGAVGILVGAFAAMYGALKAGDAVIQAHVDEYKALDRATADAAARMTKLAEAGREDWASKSGAELVRMGVSTRDVADAITALKDRIEETNNREDLSAQQKAELNAKTQEQIAALREAGQGLSEYINGTNQAADAQKGLKSQIQDTTKALQGQIAANERDNQALADATADRARMEAQHAREILQHRQTLGTATIEDQKRVTEAVQAAAEAEKKAKLQAIQQAQDAAARAAAEDPTKVFDSRVFEEQRANAERQYTLTVDAESRRRTEVRHKEGEDRRKAEEKAAKEAADAQKKTTAEAEKAAKEAESARKKATDQAARDQDALSDAQQRTARDNEQHLKRQMEAGKDNSREMASSINARYQIEADAIRRRAAADEAEHGKSAAREQALALQLQHLEGQRQDELREVIRLRHEAVEAVNDEKRALEELKGISGLQLGAVRSMAEAFANQSGFLSDNQRKPEAAGKQKPEEITDAEVAALGQQAMDAGMKTATSSTPTNPAAPAGGTQGAVVQTPDPPGQASAAQAPTDIYGRPLVTPQSYTVPTVTPIDKRGGELPAKGGPLELSDATIQKLASAMGQAIAQGDRGGGLASSLSRDLFFS